VRLGLLHGLALPAVFRVVMPCSLLYRCWHFRGTCCLPASRCES